MSALLEEEYSYLISEFTDVTDDVLLGDELFVVDAYEKDGRDWYQVRRINLNTDRGWDGLVEASIDGKGHDGERGYLSVQDNIVLVQGVAGLVLDAKTLEVLFTEESVRTDSWKHGGYAFIHDGLYYRRRAVLQPVGGIDVVDMKTSGIVDFIDCDIKGRTPPYEGLLYGERANGNFALYSLSEKEYCFEVDCAKYGEVKGRGLRYCLDGCFVYLLCGEFVLILDIARRGLVEEIHYASSEVLRDLEKEKKIRRGVRADLIAVSDGVIALSNCWIYGWGGVIDTRRSDEFSWINVWGDVAIKSVAGDLLYAMAGENPVAIDKYSGNIVWQSKKSSFANAIRVGNSWVVYSTIGGNLQCYKMKDEAYHSPDHPRS